jgi:gamma-glutamylcyclotransferase (GGCT)/AIG2-like uncharacterized protein YtfP
MVEHQIFLYGALTREKLGSIVGDVTVMCGAILKNHRITFSGSHKVFQGSSVATVSPHDGTDVLGIVYALSERQMDLLDLFMGEKTGLCKKRVVHVFDGSKTRTVTMFVSCREEGQTGGDQPRPTSAYQKLHQTLVREAYALYRTQVDAL